MEKRSGDMRGAWVLAAAAVIFAVAVAWPHAAAQGATEKLRAQYAAPEATEAGAEDAGQANSLGIDIAALISDNPDAIGWLALEGTPVDCPVVQGEADEYLNLSFDGSPSASGTLFVDPLNAPDFTDRVTFVYGHSLLDGSMFSCIPDYSDQDFFDAHGRAVLALKDRELLLSPWAAVRQKGSDGTLHVGEFEDGAEWEEYKQSVASLALATGTQDAGKIERLVCLVTCSYNSYDERTLLFCTIG